MLLVISDKLFVFLTYAVQHHNRTIKLNRCDETKVAYIHNFIANAYHQVSYEKRNWLVPTYSWSSENYMLSYGDKHKTKKQAPCPNTVRDYENYQFSHNNCNRNQASETNLLMKIFGPGLHLWTQQLLINIMLI